mgnify:CR=1 FL=1
MTPVVGGVYYRKARSGKAMVIRVEEVGEWIRYRVLHGPRRLTQQGISSCKRHNFIDWTPTDERDDYSSLDGCIIQDTFLVQDTAGQPLLRCSRKRAEFYRRKNLVIEIEPGVLRFTDPTTEIRLRSVYGAEFSAFFLAVKNDRCVGCGTPDNLTRHHVVPRRHKPRLPVEVRRRLSNVLFVCRDCHARYEETAEPDPPLEDVQGYVLAWSEHFLRTLQPRYMPYGWSIFSSRPGRESEEG